MVFMRAEEAISGKMGKAFATINGEIHEMFYVKDIEARIEKKKTEIPVLGYTGTQHKAGGWSGKGQMTIYYVTSLFRKMMLEYVRTGRDIYFDIAIANDDPTSSTGRQVTLLKGVNLDSVLIAKLDVESEALDEEVPFTFNDVDMPEQFRQLWQTNSPR